MSDDLERVERALARQVAPTSREGVIERRQGVVDAVNTDGTLDVDIGGVIVPGVKRLAHYVPLDGDSVFVEFSGTDPLVVGRVAQVPYWPNIAEERSVADGTTGSGTYVDWPTSTPLTFTHRKLLTDTHLLIKVQFSGFCDSSGINVQIGVRIDATDFDIRRFAFNQAFVHSEWAGSQRLAGVNADLHTYTMRIRLLAGANVTSDINDRQTIEVQEIPVPLST